MLVVGVACRLVAAVDLEHVAVVVETVDVGDVVVVLAHSMMAVVVLVQW